MEAVLKEINAVLGVIGSFVCRSDGALAAAAMPEPFDDARLQMAARIASQTLDALEMSGQRVHEADLLFFKGRLIVKNLRGGTLFILCARSINLPLLNLTANVAAKKITADLRPAKPEVVAAPAPTPTPTPMPAPKTAIADVAPTPLAMELDEELKRINTMAEEFRITLRAMNFPAMWLACQRARALIAPPDKKQLDLAAFGKQSDAMTLLFERLGYQSNQRFNAFYGNRRMNFADATRGMSVDIFFDTYEMYHRLDLTPFLDHAGLALGETALLLMRLQLVETSDAVLRDLGALLLEHDLSVGPEKDKIDAAYITRLCADDWGWYKTLTTNLDRAGVFAYATLTPADRAIIDERVQRLKQSIDHAPKSLRWQTRARIGETMRWYETPQVFSPSRPRPDMALG